MANEAIGILFEVAGQGDIHKGAGKRINGQLRHLVGQINKSSTVKLNFKIDESAIQKQLKNIQERIKELEKASSSQKQQRSTNKDSGATGQASAYQQARKAISDYYAAKTKYERKASRSVDPSKEYKDLYRALNAAKAAGQDYFEVATNGSVKLKDGIAGITEEQYELLRAFRNSQGLKSQAELTDITKNAQSAWSNLTQKVNDYIRRVEYSASRDEKAKQGLKELRDLANNTDYHGYDELKKKLAEINQYINENSLDTETWGQKFAKTFGSRVRSALAGIITAKIGQYLKEVYDNVLKLDTAMANLQIASGKTRVEIESLTSSYAKLAQQLGATTIEVAEAADTWLRQGYAAKEANTLIRNSTMLSKLGQMEAAEASTALTSAMKGYGVAVDDSIGIVDKLTKVDMEAAASAGDIATAMAETATSAKLAGVSMDTLIGYIATVKEVTQDGAESVGTFYKTLFARMNNVAAGNFIDEETGESLNDVETVLNKLGIALRDTNGEFRSSSEVLAEVGSRWTTFNTVQQHAIATAMAGTRQQEKFIVLMENYGTAVNYANTATASSGTAMEKYSTYAESLEGRLNTLSASFEELSMNLLDSSLVAGFIDILTAVVDVLGVISDWGNGFVVTLTLVSVATIAAFTLMSAVATKFSETLKTVKASLISTLKDPMTYITILSSLIISLSQSSSQGAKIVAVSMALISLAVITACVLIKTGVWSLATTTSAAAATISTAIMNIPIFGWIVAIISAVIAAVTAIVSLIKSIAGKQQEMRDDAIKTAQAMQEQADAMREVADAANDAAKSVHSLVDEFKALQEETPVDAAEWLDKLEEIGSEAAALFGDEQLTSIQAINKLVEDDLTYNELINMTMEQRLGLLEKIRQGAAAVSGETAREAYRAQKFASDQMMNALTMTDKLKKDDERWGSASNNVKKSNIDEAVNIANGISGLTISRDGKNADITVSAGSLSEYVNVLKSAVNEYKELYKYNAGALADNGVYQYLNDALLQAQESLNAQTQTVYSMLETATETHGMNVEVKFDESATKEEAKNTYDTTVNTIMENLRKDSGIAEAIQDGLLGDDEEVQKTLREYAEKYVRTYHTELFNAVNKMPVNVIGRKAIDIYDELDGEMTLLIDAIDQFNETGNVAADTIRQMTDEFPDLLKYIRETENGFELIEGSTDEILNGYLLEKAQEFQQQILDAYEYYNEVKASYEAADVRTIEEAEVVKGAYESVKKAIDEGNAFITALNARTDELLEEQYKNLLEEQTDALEKQADAFSELCDIRKELLKTYQEELDYQNELAERQKKVSDLQTKLSVAKLDNSAAGQARVRQLEADLKDAQEELDEFTLEHAIDILTAQIENSDNQYRAIIDEGVQRLEAAIASAGQMTSTALKEAITSMGSTPTTGNTGSDASNAVSGTISGIQLPDKPYADDKAPSVKESEPEHNTDPAPIETGVLNSSAYSVSGLNKASAGWDDCKVTLGGTTYKVATYDSEDNRVDAYTQGELNNLFGGTRPAAGTMAAYKGKVYVVSKDGGWVDFAPKNDKDSMEAAFLRILNGSSYHTGGLVGGEATLSSSEEFAKLLKGEFVSTPSQMKHFMEDTLPSIASYQSGGNNEFNAPLIEIKCDNVTSESIPKLERVVDEAVKEIQKQLNSGMSRAGHKRPQTKRLNNLG